MIYFVQRADGAIKIGATKRFRERFGRLQLEHGKLALLGAMPGYFEEEKALHLKFSAYNIEGEWFQPVPELLDWIDLNTDCDLANDAKASRITLTVKLVPDKDDDLIAWYQSLPIGEKHQVTKDTLHKGIRLIAKQAASMSRAESVRQQVDIRFNEWSTELMRYVQDIVADHLKDMQLTATAPLAEPVESVGRVTQTELDKRAANLKKAKW